MALTTQEGDVVVRSDSQDTYIHNGGSAGTMGDFTLLSSSADNSTNVTLVTTSHDYLSISGQAITLGTIDISDDTNLTAGTGITLTGDTLSVNTSAVDHDSLSNFVANEHIDWTSDQGSTNIHTGNYTNTTYTSSDFTHDDLTGFVANEHIDWTSDQGSTNIHTGNYTNTTYTSSDFTHDDLTGFVANEHIDWTSDQGSTNIHTGNYTNTTYTSSDFTHDDLTGFVANEHIDWTTASAGTIHISNISQSSITAGGVTVSDNNDNANYEVVFTNLNGMYEDSSQFYYNPSTGTLRVPNLTVQGTTTTVDTVEMQAQNAVVFEGATADANETTLTITDPTADRTITLPDITGTVITTGNLSSITALGTVATCTGLTIQGAFAATTKSFDIPHPSKKGKRLVHGSLEGAEHGVYHRGKSNENEVKLPDFWVGLVDFGSITVQLTPIGRFQGLWVENISEDRIIVGSEDENIEFYYLIHAERVDVDKLEVEVNDVSY